MGCCTFFSKLVHYVMDTIIFLMGCGILAVSIYLLASDFNGFVDEWWVWVALAGGIVLIVGGILGCIGTKMGGKCILAVYGILPGVMFVLILAGAISASVYLSYTNDLSDKSPAELNVLDNGSNAFEVYDHIREAYGDLWTDKSCDVNCTVTSLSTLECGEVTCDDGTVEDWMNDWIEDGAPRVSAPSFETCRVLALGADGIGLSVSAATGWCASNTAVIDDVNDWALGVMIALWVVAGVLMLLLIVNCVLLKQKKKEKSRGVVIAPTNANTPADADAFVGTPENVNRENPATAV
ncbi:hypothetical protein FOZ63_013601 [Perkinsus olseni]|uniref:Uncharacterized protein n=1 Tax=Perkinsus olseni TaxID=32597 RepID=A0A7J6TEW2_PEROL|nr:hypothetical protein FOZ63_013601 [Perkinsus olseni]KAF4743292.1 hypothetical protein FOZ62_018226 [Perkinsus olseni]